MKVQARLLGRDNFTRYMEEYGWEFEDYSNGTLVFNKQVSFDLYSLYYDFHTKTVDYHKNMDLIASDKLHTLKDLDNFHLTKFQG